MFLLPSPPSCLLLFISLYPHLILSYKDDAFLHLQPQIPLNQASITPPPPPHQFHLQYIFHHGTHRYPSLHRKLQVNPHNIKSVTADHGLSFQAVPSHLSAKRQPITIHRLVDRNVSTVEGHLSNARETGRVRNVPNNYYPSLLYTTTPTWSFDQVDAPNISDKDTVLSLAKMAANAYIMLPGTEKWEDVSPPFNHSQNFGWEDDGLRGHIYADADNSTIVISLKGTTTALFDGQGTTTNDKVNDNLFFSCCCGQGGSFLWRQVCDCSTDTYTCNATCLSANLRAENRYYRAALDLYANVTSIYPSSNVWLVGHSLGGAISSMLGQTYGLPVVTFEAVPEALPSSRLGLPLPPANDTHAPLHHQRDFTGAYHFGHTADPLFMGTCNSMTSVCTLAGYALESSCHTGFRCVYDTVEDLGWRSGIGTHRILTVISDVIERYDTVPECVRDEDCVDCFNWKFFESNHSEPTLPPPTSTSTSTVTGTRTRTRTRTRTGTGTGTGTRMRTSTCKTPGWWGCLDPTTTTTTTATATTTKKTSVATENPTTSTSASSTTCHTPGWFGCKDLPTTTTTRSKSSSSSSSSCRNPGWFGCNDPTTTTTTTALTATKKNTDTLPAPTAIMSPSSITATLSKIPTATTSVCLTPGIIFGCWDQPERTTTTATTSSRCENPWFFWGCHD